MYNSHLYYDSLYHVTTEMLLDLVELFQNLLQTSSRSMLQHQPQRSQDDAVQLDDVRVPQGREEGQLLLEVGEPDQDRVTGGGLGERGFLIGGGVCRAGAFSGPFFREGF